MAFALIYYRTDGTLSGEADTRKGANGSSYYDPTDLPSAQKLEFDFPDNVLESIKDSYVNNIVDIPVPISDGTRRVNKQENGMKSLTLTVSGVFKNPNSNADILKLKTIRQTPQLDEAHPFGRIGFYSPNATAYTLDPSATSSVNATQGFTISSVDIGFVGQKKTRYGFTVALSFGGTL
jgi:hypothetical protein|tara:strand:- start:219 stop:755 length:537 start_codon:yes stop_codon:yes gene_type:complete